MKMRWRGLLLLPALVAAVAFMPSPSEAGVSVDVGFFYDDLAPHGNWMEMQGYGWVWTPRHVPADWRPYSRGHWVLTVDDGWLWVSDEDWGWATCHYGRWFLDPTYGWVWVPGREWAPAWVSWRTGGGYVGWAPLAPGFRWNAAVGFRVGDVDLDALIAPSRYVFVPESHFLDARVFHSAVPVSRNVVVVRSTRNVTRYAVANHHPVNLGVDVGEIERSAHHAVPRVRVVEGTSRTAVSRGSAGTVRVFRPEVPEVKGRTPPGARARTGVKPRPVEPRGPQVAPPRAERSPDWRAGDHGPKRDNRVAENARDAKARETEDARRKQQAKAREQKKQQAKAREQQRRAEQARREERQRQQRAEQAHQKQQEKERRRAQEQAQKRPAQGEPDKS